MDHAVRRRFAAMHAGWLVPAVYVAVGVALFASTLNMFFVSDDFEFLAIVTRAESPLVIFEPLVGRYVRPLVVLMYYACYRAFGLAPWAYHIATLVPHLLSAWLVFVVAKRLGGPGAEFKSFLAGLLFVSFSGHSEAVAWPAGIADPILTVCTLAALWCYLRALEPAASSVWLAGMFLAIGTASLAKELWVVFPGLLLVHAIAFGVFTDPRTRRRSLLAICGTCAMVGSYLVLRLLVFGSVAGGYTGLGLSGGQLDQVNAFLLRSFLPATAHLAGWPGRWLVGIAAIATLALLLWWARGRAARILVFSALAIVVALVPVMPLTISLSTSESERFVYLPTAFSCLLMIWAVHTALAPRAAAVLCGCVIAVHAGLLLEANARWKAAGTLAHDVLTSYADLAVQEDPRSTASLFVLNLPDNLGGAYVFRNGFVPAIRLFRPDVGNRLTNTVVVSTQYLGAASDQAWLTNSGSGRFRIDLGATNRLIHSTVPSGLHYRIMASRPHQYELQFEPSVGTAVVAYLTNGRLRSAGTFVGPGLPFGAVDVPTDGATCDGESTAFAGWALDDDEIDRITLEEIGTTRDGNREVRALGAAHLGDPRSDVATVFPRYLSASRAGWVFHLPCDRVRRAPGGMMRVRVTAYDRNGRSAVLGERRLQPPR